MTKTLAIFILLLYSCGSGNNNVQVKQDTINHVKDVQQKIRLTTKKEMLDSNFLSFWKGFIEIIESSNRKKFKSISFDSLNCENKNVSIDEFIKSYFSMVFDDTLKTRLSDSSKVDFINEEIDGAYISKSIMRQIKNGKVVIKKVNITKIDKYSEGHLIIVLEFIETITGYKFYGYDRFG